MKKWSRELFEVFGIKLVGTAFTILESVESGNGFEVWRKLREDSKPSTPTGALRSIMEVMVCKKVINIKEIMSTLTEWEVKVQRVLRDHGEVITDRMKLAIAITMCPLNIQENILAAADRV